MEPVAAAEIKQLVKIYTDFWGRSKVHALNGLNLTIRQGEIFGLLGPNGSGKTTTIKLLLGLLRPTGGSVSVLGYPAAHVSKNALIGYLPEESYLYRFLTGEETLVFYGRLFGLRGEALRRRVNELLDLVRLDRRARKRALKEYSKGMSRRIGLAQALINNPKFVLLDEPTTGLDPVGTREMKDLILAMKAEGRTVLMSSHLLADVEDVCDRIAILVRGDMRECGDVKELLLVRDIVQLRARNVRADVVRQVQALLADSGAQDVETSHPRMTLEELFLNVISQDGRPPAP
ncbi:MAG TPA: ABC transporter ATP-binding protein [Phycisphaerae bacterium]|nr:ABC transporter ATP-binding protein [Phycisphaerae bacterium]HOI55765.1 ABC transporter ATP-binding protein [Phycisphaerae bacterium]